MSRKGPPPFFISGGDFRYNRAGPDAMDKTLLVIEEMTRLGIIKAYAIGGGIAATYYRGR